LARCLDLPLWAFGNVRYEHAPGAAAYLAGLGQFTMRTTHSIMLGCASAWKQREAVEGCTVGPRCDRLPLHAAACTHCLVTSLPGPCRTSPLPASGPTLLLRNCTVVVSPQELLLWRACLQVHILPPGALKHNCKVAVRLQCQAVSR
jgi:hypothetical protein